MPDELLPKLEAYIRARDPQGSARIEGDDTVVKFSTLGAPQELRIRSDRSSAGTFAYMVTLPGAKERWFLESKGVWFPEHSGCKRVGYPPLDERYKLYASDEAYFVAVFGGHDLAQMMLELPAEDHVKASLQDEVLSLSWDLRSNSQQGNREDFLLNAADRMIRLGVQCFKGVQLARLTRGESTGFAREQDPEQA